MTPGAPNLSYNRINLGPVRSQNHIIIAYPELQKIHQRAAKVLVRRGLMAQRYGTVCILRSLRLIMVLVLRSCTRIWSFKANSGKGISLTNAARTLYSKRRVNSPSAQTPTLPFKAKLVRDSSNTKVGSLVQRALYFHARLALFVTGEDQPELDTSLHTNLIYKSKYKW